MRPPSPVRFRAVDPRRLSAGEWIAATAGVLLLVSLFLTWYDPGVSGWEAFSITDILLALTAVLALAGWATGAGDRTHPTGVAVLSLTMLASFFAVLVVLYRTLDPPGDGSAERALGAWLGLAGVLGVAGGTLRAMRDEGPARRSPETERAAAADALARAELLPLPGEGRPEGSAG